MRRKCVPASLVPDGSGRQPNGASGSSSPGGATNRSHRVTQTAPGYPALLNGRRRCHGAGPELPASQDLTGPNRVDHLVMLMDTFLMSPCDEMEKDWRFPRVTTERLAENPGASTTALMDPALSRPLRLPLTPRLDSLHEPAMFPFSLITSLFRSKR